MSNSYETLKLVGREKFTYLHEYADSRITDLRKQYDSTSTMEEVKQIQGRVHELQNLKANLDYLVNRNA